MRRIGSFVAAIVSIVIAGVLLYLVRDMSMTTDNNGLKALALVVVFPVYLLIYGLLFGACLTAVIASIKGITSCVVSIRVLSILLLLLSLAETCLGVVLLKGVLI